MVKRTAAIRSRSLCSQGEALLEDKAGVEGKVVVVQAVERWDALGKECRWQCKTRWWWWNLMVKCQWWSHGKWWWWLRLDGWNRLWYKRIGLP